MNEPALSVRDLSKAYRLGVLSRKYLADELRYWWHRVRGRNPALHMCTVDTAEREAELLEQDIPGTFWALKDVSFDVHPGEVVGIIGRNGAGKSTLLKILSRITEPTAGEVVLEGRVGSLLEVGTGFHPELTGRENIFMNATILGMRKREVDAKFDEIVDFAEIEQFLDTPVKRYSSGMYVRLAFAVAAHLEPEILVVDEVLAVGDTAFQKKCMGKMGEVAKAGRTILFVSHNMAAIENLCSRCILLQHGQLVADGPTKSVIAGYLQEGPDSSSSSGALAEHTARTGSGVVVLTDFHLEDAQGNRVSAIQSGADAVLAFSLHNRSGKPVHGLDVGFGIQDSTGSQTLSVLYGSYQNQEFDLLQERGCVRCRIAALPLAARRYHLVARLTIKGQESDWPQPGVGFLDVVAGDFFASGSEGFRGGDAPLLVKGIWSLEEGSGHAQRRGP